MAVAYETETPHATRTELGPYPLLHELASHRGGYAVVSPVDVVLAEHSIVQPDVIYVSKERAGSDVPGEVGLDRER